MQQLFLQFPKKEDFSSEDFFISESNEKAFSYITQHSKYNNGIYPTILLLYGDSGSGKTHLAHIWQKSTGSKFIELQNDEINANGSLIVENIEDKDQKLLLHLINLMNENKQYLLLTSRLSPSRLNFSLPDLNSRLLSIPSISIETPDQELLKAVLLKNLVDRQLKIHPATIDYVLTRIERSFNKLFEFINELEHISKTEKRAITIPMVKKIIESS